MLMFESLLYFSQQYVIAITQVNLLYDNGSQVMQHCVGKTTHVKRKFLRITSSAVLSTKFDAIECDPINNYGKFKVVVKINNTTVDATILQKVRRSAALQTRVWCFVNVTTLHRGLNYPFITTSIAEPQFGSFFLSPNAR